MYDNLLYLIMVKFVKLSWGELCHKYIDALKYVALGFKQVYVVQSDIL